MKHNPISDSRKEIIRKMLIKGLVRESLALPPMSEPVIAMAKSFQIVDKEKIGPYKLVLTKNPKDSRYIMYGGPAGVWEWPLKAPTQPQWIPMPPMPDLAQSWSNYKEDAGKEAKALLIDVNKTLDYISDADPTDSGQYAMWIVRMVFNESLQFPDDVEKVSEDLFSYHEKKHRGIIPQEFRDINQFATYGKFFALLEQYQEQISGREQLKLALREGKTVYQSDTYTAIEVKSWQLAKHLAAGTGWCVRGTNMAKSYLKDPDNYPLYFFFVDEKPYALLTNRPDDPQFMDRHNDPIENLNGELRSILRELSAWIFCGMCGRESWGKSYDLASYINKQRSELKLGAQELRLAWTGPALIAEIPSPLKGRPVIASPEMLESKIVIGPTDALMKIPGVRLPAIQKFAEKAGFSADDYIRPLLKVDACDVCLYPDDDNENIVGKVLSTLYSLSFCEDYPCCGHELLPMGAPGCPPMYGPGNQVGMRCVCGAFVPPGNRYSICRTCLEAGESEQYDSGYDSDPYDELYDDEYDGHPIEDMHDTIRPILKGWENPGYRQEPYSFKALPSWKQFDSLMYMLDHPNYGGRLPSSKNKRGAIQVLTDYWKRGYFDIEDFRDTMLPNLKLLYAIVTKAYEELDQ